MSAETYSNQWKSVVSMDEMSIRMDVYLYRYAGLLSHEGGQDQIHLQHFVKLGQLAQGKPRIKRAFPFRLIRKTKSLKNHRTYYVYIV